MRRKSSMKLYYIILHLHDVGDMKTVTSDQIHVHSQPSGSEVQDYCCLDQLVSLLVYGGEESSSTCE